MTFRRAVGWTGGVWILAITALHAWLNLDLFAPRAEAGTSFKVGFLPVT